MIAPGAIGGYFGLELPQAGPMPHAGAIGFQSARAAFAALLRLHPPRKVWVPRYLCDAMLAPLRAGGVPHAFYALTRDFEVADDITLAEGEWLVHVNHFGIAAGAQRRTRERFGADRVVCDNAQAFFAPPQPGLATIYSARKFFGVPDGGLIYADLASPPAANDRVVASAHLLARLAGEPEDGYEDYLAAEKGFDDLEPRAQSRLSARVLATIDLEQVARSRRANYAFLHARLGARNRLAVPADADGGVPLCYPYLADRPGLRAELAARRIFTAGYWPEVVARAPAGSFEADLAAHLVAVPCDQRYGPGDLQRVVDALRDLAP